MGTTSSESGATAMATPVPDELLFGHRMNADKAFSEQVAHSEFSRGEWELIMSVISFEIDDPQDPENASLLPVVDELDRALQAAKEVPGANDPYSREGGSSGGVIDRITGLFGGESKTTGDRRGEAEALVGEYAQVLEAQLKEQAAWATLCEESRSTD